jgi:hypothetical protein
MRNIIAIALNVRVHASLCCIAAILLSACGGGTSDSASREQVQTAAYSYNSAATVANDATYDLYVASTGSDSNPGTELAPFKTISRAAGLARPSTTVHVAAGTYEENVKSNTKGQPFKGALLSNGDGMARHFWH